MFLTHSIPDERARWFACGIIALALLLTGLGETLQPLERAWLDARFALRRVYLASDPMPEVVLIAADEASLREITAPLALWHQPLARVLARIAAMEPRAVGLDFALPEHSYDDLLPGGDASLAKALVQLRRAAPLVLALGADSATGKTQALHPLFAAAAGLENSGLAYFPRDADGAIRHFSEALGQGGETVPTLAGQLVRRLGGAAQAGIIDFSRGPPFQYLPLHELARANEQGLEEFAQRIRGRIVLVGTALPFLDRHVAPVRLAAWDHSPDQPGLVLQAQALRSLLGGTQITTAPAALQWLIAALAGTLVLAPLRLRHWMSLGAAVLLTGALVSLFALDFGLDFPVLAPLLALIMGGAFHFTWHFRAARQARARLLATFGGFVSPQVLRILLEEKIDPARPLRRRLAFLFADLRDFSGLTARLSPDAVFGVLNRYYAAVTPVLHAQGATIDNFRGDGLMAFFGAPQELEDPRSAAVAAALAAIDAVAALNREFASEGLPTLRLGIALAEGDAVTGNLGDQSRNNYTALADAANVAAHLQNIARNFDCPIIATGPIAAIDPSRWQSLGTWTIKDGREIEVFGLSV